MPPLVGGVAISTKRLYQNLLDDGFDAHYYNVHPVWKYCNEKISIVLSFIVLPFWILVHRKFDIIHCHVPGTYRKIYISLIKPFLKGAKVIHTIHGDIDSALDKKVVKYLEKVDKIICVQKGDSQRLPKTLRPLAVDIPAFILPKNISEENIPQDIISFIKDSNKPVILFYGAVVISKQFPDLYGIKDVIDVCEYLESKSLDFRCLMLISDDGKHDAFMSEIFERIKEKQDIMLIYNKAIPMLPLFKYSNLYLRPTKTDGDSLAVREALASSCSVIASNAAVRPSEVIVYENIADLYTKVEQQLHIAPSISVQTDFYEQIKNVYLKLFK